MRETDLADELFGQPGKTALPAGVRVATARQGGVTITRVEISREVQGSWTLCGLSVFYSWE